MNSTDESQVVRNTHTGFHCFIQFIYFMRTCHTDYILRQSALDAHIPTKSNHLLVEYINNAKIIWTLFYFFLSTSQYFYPFLNKTTFIIGVIQWKGIYDVQNYFPS